MPGYARGIERLREARDEGGEKVRKTYRVEN